MLPTTDYPLYYITGHRRACSSISSSVLHVYSRVSFVDINEKSDSIDRNKYQTVQTKLIIDSKLIMPGTRNAISLDHEECNENRREFIMSAHLCGHKELYPEIKYLVKSTNEMFFDHMKNCFYCLPIYRANKNKIKSLDSNAYKCDKNHRKIVKILSLICRKLN